VEDAGSSETQICNPKRYWIRGEHGRGARGCVSRAHDRKLGRDIAIKELISRGALNEARFMREALITARLQHPGIVPVYEAGCWPDGTPFYAMKLVAGRSLRDLLIECKTIDERIPLLHHVIGVADAIAYAHDCNIIHRDLKPANVIVGDFGETVVIDWGLAKDLTVGEESSTSGGPLRVTRDDDLTATGSVIGTPAYMPPEQRRGEPVDQRADVFAIGAMLWELCALQRTSPASATQRRRVLRRAGIDRDLVAIIDKALEPDPAGRYHDAGGLAADLKAFKSGARVGARSYSLYAMLAHWTRRHRALAVSATIALVLAATGTVMYVGNIAAERDRADAALHDARREREQHRVGRRRAVDVRQERRRGEALGGARRIAVAAPHDRRERDDAKREGDAHPVGGVRR
jgi:serine/threonine protein kinase